MAGYGLKDTEDKLKGLKRKIQEAKPVPHIEKWQRKLVGYVAAGFLLHATLTMTTAYYANLPFQTFVQQQYRAAYEYWMHGGARSDLRALVKD